MFIVKSRAELMRFGLFLAVVAFLIWYVAGRTDLWRTSEQPSAGTLPTGSALRQSVPAPAPVVAPGAAQSASQGAAQNSANKAQNSGAKGGESSRPATGATALDLSDGRDYFAEYRIDRERTRGALGERLKELMDSQSATDEVRRQASQEYLKLGQTTALESRAEAMVKARGFDDVIVSLADGSAQVVVKASTLSQQQVLQVMDTVSRITGVKNSGITVLPKYR